MQAHEGEESDDRICFFFWEMVLVAQDAVKWPIAEFVDMPQFA
jgi:hypothetical protein